MKISKLFITAVFASLISLATPGFADADTVYTYTGTPYTSCIASYACNGTTPSLTVMLDLGSALAAGLTNADISGSINTFSLSDGIDVSLTNTNATASLFYVSTDASGNIIGWDLMAAEIYVTILTGFGLGHLLHYGRELHAMDQVIGVMLVIITIGLLTDKILFSPIERFLHNRWGTGLR